MRGRVRPLLVVLSLLPNVLLSAWLGFRLSILLGRPILLQPQNPGYVLSIFAVTSLCFGVITWAVYSALGLRFMRFPNGKLVLVDAPALLRLRQTQSGSKG
jgi:hypothetical protein